MTKADKPLEGDDALYRWMDYCAAVAEFNGFRHSTWSIGPDKGFTTFEDPHPYSGATALIYEIYAGFGDRPGGNVFQAADIKGPRWLDLWRAAEDILSRSRDRHHRFIEQFVQQKSGVLRLRTRELR